jgi:hypothetical protein
MTPVGSPVPGPVYRSGDVLRIACPFTGTTVTGLTRFHVSVRWPWNRVDPGAERLRWNGSRAIAKRAATTYYGSCLRTTLTLHA